MPHTQREDLLKEIVFFMHQSLKKNKKQSTAPQNESNSLQHFPWSDEKIRLAWPLKRGSVEKNTLAWNFYESNTDVINAFVAYTIKSFAVGLKKKNLSLSQIYSNDSPQGLKSNSGLNIDKIFRNQFSQSFFWDDIKKYYQAYSMDQLFQKENRPLAVRNILPHSSCVILGLDAAFFRLRSGSNQELASFECFIEDLYNANNSLIVFSRQNLLPQTKNSLKVNDYSISFKMNKDIIKSSIYEALEPQAHLIQSNRFIEPTKTGCFDRLVHLLSLGQSEIQKVEREYSNWGGENSMPQKLNSMDL